MNNKLEKRMEENRIIGKLRRFIISDVFIIIEFLTGAAFVVARGMGNIMPLVYGLITMGVIVSFILVICDDLTPTLFPFLTACCIAIKCYDSYSTFIKYIWAAPIFAAALVFHFVVYRRPLDKGKNLRGLIAVAVAVTLGGLGKITAAEYFNPVALFYVFGLGFGMVLVYLLMNTYYRSGNENYNFRVKFSFVMTMVGLFCVFMIVHHYILFWDNFIVKQSPLNFQWRNNVSTLLMLALPFPFFLSTRKYPYIFAGMLLYAGIMITGSRGGAIGGTLELALCLGALIFSDEKNRKTTLIIIASVVFVALTFFLKPLFTFFGPVLQRLAGGDDIREQLISAAVRDFRSNVLFGRGLGYKGNESFDYTPTFSLCWYHSAPFQIIGSFGLVGAVCYVYQFAERMKVIWKRVTHFNITLFVSYAGLFLMSLVNPGEFCPVPYGIFAVLLFILCDKNNIADEITGNTDAEIIKF